MVLLHQKSAKLNRDHINLVTVSEKVNLAKDQHELLNIICNIYEISISEYMQEALIEAMRFDIEEGNFSEVLLGKLDEYKTTNSSPHASSMKNELDKIQKSQMSWQ
jgi:hypothetical protein